MTIEKYLKYLDKLIRAADFSEQTSIHLHKLLRREGLSNGESLDVMRFMEESGWLKNEEGSRHVRLTFLGRTVWQRNNLLAVHTIVVSETEATADGKEGVKRQFVMITGAMMLVSPSTEKSMASKCGAFSSRGRSQK